MENWVASGEKQNNQPFLEASMDPSLIKKYAPKDEERFAYTFNCDKNKLDKDRLELGLTPENVDKKVKAESLFGYLPNYHILP